MKIRTALPSIGIVLGLLATTPALAVRDTSVDTVCASNVVTNREVAIANAFSNFTSNMNTAYVNRRNALQSAWLVSNKDDRRNAVKAAWNNFKTASAAAKKSWKDTVRNEWKNFNENAKNCRNMERSFDTGNQGLDR